MNSDVFIIWVEVKRRMQLIHIFMNAMQLYAYYA